MTTRTSLPSVTVVSTTGTITGVGRDRLDMVEYGETGTRLRVDELLARVPEAHDIARVNGSLFRALVFDVCPADWLELHRHLADVLKGGPSGVVVTHGTSFMEETAYFMHLTLKTETPVVFVGAQRPSTAIGQDGDLNLLNAVRVAASPQSRGMGVLVCLNDEINSAREVSKTSTFRVQAFQSRDLGFLGYADADGRVVYYRRPTRRHTLRSEFDVSGLAELPRVDIVSVYAGCDGSLVEAAVERGARGIVTAGAGAGSTSTAMTQALQRAVEQGIPVVESSRVGSGRVTMTQRRRRHRLIAADNLAPQKARVLLMLALTRTTDLEEIQRIVNEY